MLVGIEAADCLAEHLADTIVPVGPRRLHGAHRPTRAVEPDHVVRRGEDEAPHTRLASGFEHAVGTDGVGGEDLLRRSAGLARNPCEVDYAVHAFGRLFRRPGHGEIARHHLLARRRVLNRAQIMPAQRFRRAAQRRAQHAADLARCARQQQALRPHALSPRARLWRRR
jgi:hypothetical protein